MNNNLRITAEAVAHHLLQCFRQEHPTWTDDRTPLDELVAWLGLHVATFHPDDYPKGTYGFLDPDEDENLIWLQRDLQGTFRRFTLAHELGHAVLHCQGNKRLQALLGSNLYSLIANQDTQESLPEPSRKDPCHESDVQANMIGICEQELFQDTLGIGEAYDPRSQRELAANIFAAELLIPCERVRTLYLTERVAPNTLTSVFAVSNVAMLNRLAALLKGPPAVTLPTQNNSTERPAKKAYDEFQQAAITAPTPALIVAGPGSGKTSTLIGRTEYIIRTLGIQAQHILALTFSRKAAQEMSERLQLALGGNTLPKVSTFHAYCAELLRQHGKLVGLRPDFALIDEAEGYFLLRQQANKMRLYHYQKLQSPAYYFPDILKAISRAKDELVSPESYAHLAQQMKEQADDDETMLKAEKALEVAHVYALYQQGLSQRGDTDFGGLLTLTIQLFQQHPEVLREQQRKYQHILVDEFQDVNRASGVLLRYLAGEARHVWVVGDANQAIYGFRGASPANISQFESDFPGAAILPLNRNYRSRPDLVSLAEAFRCAQLEPGQQSGKNQAVRMTQSDAYITLAKATDENSELAGLVQDIRHKHSNGYSYKEMIVLCRTRAHAKKVSHALAEANLPVIERGGMLEQEHSKDLLSIMMLLTDPSGMGLLRAARQSEHPLTQADIEALLLAIHQQKTSIRMLLCTGEAPLDLSLEGRRSFNRLAEIIQTLQHSTDIWSLLAQYLFIETPLLRDLLCQQESKQRRALLNDYDNLLQLARHYDQQQQARFLQRELEASKQGEMQPVPPMLEESIKGFLEYLSLLVLLRQDGGSRQGAEETDEEQADIIRIMTVHASKGLEFPIVYMPGLVQRRFPTQARPGPISPPKGMLPLESEGSIVHESGEACLFYVGVTRARDHLVLSYSERYGKLKYKRSSYLDMLERGLSAERQTELHWESQMVAATSTISQPLAPPSQPTENFINAMKPTTLSASAIEAYQRCPRQYAYSTIYRFTGDMHSYQLFWQATQKTIETLRKQMQESSHIKQHPTQEDIQALYTQHWQELGGHTVPFGLMYEEHGHEVVETIRQKLVLQGKTTWNIHPKYIVNVAGQAVHITVDRVETSKQASEPMKFVRTRFGRRKDKPSAETRELFYTLASRQLYPGQNVELYSHNLSTDEITPITMTTKKEQSLYEEVEQSIQRLEHNEYPAQPAEPYRCPTCPFFLICSA